MSLLVGYLRKDTLEIYRYIENQPIREAAGPLDLLEPIRGLFDQKVLIVSRENLYHLRKRYPPTDRDKIAKAISLEAKDLFPFSDPGYYFQIRESFPTHTLIDLWGWEKETVESLRKIFPYGYLVPEDLAFVSEIPVTRIYNQEGVVHFLAHSEKQFLSGTSFPADRIEEVDVERFFHALGPAAKSMQKIKIYGSLLKGFVGKGVPEIERKPALGYPICMETVPALNLKEFKARNLTFQLPFPFDLEKMARMIIILFLGYGFMLFLTVRNYDKGIGEIKQKIRFLDQKINQNLPSRQQEDYSWIVREVNEKLKATPSVIMVGNLLARKLPKGTFLNRMVLNENTLELAVSSKEPLTVVKELSNTEGVKLVKLKGPPNKEKTGSYLFAITVELNGALLLNQEARDQGIW
jgi:hypothetical protein